MLEERNETVTVLNGALMPEDGDAFHEKNPYSEKHRTAFGNELDKLLPKIKEWHLNPEVEFMKEMSRKGRESFLKKAHKFFVNDEGCLYHRRSEDPNRPQLVVEKEDRMYMLHCAHDNLGHKGTFVTQSIIEE